MSEELILYDVPGKQGRCWSPNVWKVRAVLNYKKIPYKTEWIEYPDIKPKFKDLGIPPNAPDDFADYTVPMLKFADGSYMMDSLPIVQRLETLYPEPSLPMDLDLLKRMGSTQAKALGPLSAVIIPRVRRNVLCEPSEAWFKQDRERRFGMPEEQYEREHGGEGAWKSAKDGQQLLASFLKEQKQDEGPFILGSTVCYVDFVLVGRLEFADAVGDEVYERFVSGVDGLRELHQACKPWFERSDH